MSGAAAVTAIFARVEIGALREEFPVLRRVAYLNAGTDGPLPTRARDAATAELQRELDAGRAHAHFQRRSELSTTLRQGYAGVLGCGPEDLALTTCTSEGLSIIIEGLGLRTGDEIVTSDEEHPGLLGALQAARDLCGVRVRVVPFDELANAVAPATTLVACSHVNWTRGAFAPAELAQVQAPVVLDGAQGAGAVPVDVAALGCDAYAAAGQKWLCGPDGIGMLYVSPALRERLDVRRRTYANLADGAAGLDATLHPDARRFDAASLSAEATASAGAALALLAEHGWAAVHERAIALADRFAHSLRDAGRTVASRGASTLVSFSSADPDGERERLAEAGVILRSLPGGRWLRASVGAWNDDGDLERLLAGLDR